jgi:hypothetical protein
MRYIQGDTNEDGSRYLPYDDDLMEYRDHQYYLKTSGIKSKLGIDLSALVTPPLTDLIVLDEISDQIYEYIYDNPNNFAYEVAEFKSARTIVGREGIYKAMIAQLRYAYRTGKNLDEYNEPISNRAKTILSGEQSGRLAFKGSYTYRVNPDSTDDDGYRNGY